MKNNNTLFGDMPNKIEEEWKGMPEFKMKNLTSHRKLIVHFRSDADLVRFAELLGQRITAKQKSLWFPKMEQRITSDKHYVCEEK